MGLTRFPYGVSSFGIPQLGGGGVPAMWGNYYFVDWVNGSDDNDGTSMSNAVKTITTAYGLCTTGNNDVILVNGGSYAADTTYKYAEAAMITWSKHQIHVVGMSTPNRSDPLPEWNLSSTGNAADNAATLKVTGKGNTFTNLRIYSDGTHANNVAALYDSGEGNVYTNCHFAKNSDLGETEVCDVYARGDTSTFYQCKFGVTWRKVTAARKGLWINGAGGVRMAANRFEDCYFVVATSDADYMHIEVESTGSLVFDNIFVNCIFNAVPINSYGTATTTVAVASVSGLVEGNLLFINPATNSGSFATTTNQLQAIGHGVANSTTTTVGLCITPT